MYAPLPEHCGASSMYPWKKNGYKEADIYSNYWASGI
jgi:hypothetical protein